MIKRVVVFFLGQRQENFFISILNNPLLSHNTHTHIHINSRFVFVIEKQQHYGRIIALKWLFVYSISISLIFFCSLKENSSFHFRFNIIFAMFWFAWLRLKFNLNIRCFFSFYGKYLLNYIFLDCECNHYARDRKRKKNSANSYLSYFTYCRVKKNTA